MLWPFDPIREIFCYTAGSRQNRLASLRAVGGALIITIATAANPYAGQGPVPEEGGEVPSTNGAHLQQLAHTDLFRILGKEVHSPSGQTMGRIVDLLVDETGQPRAAIIDFGGFLGVGTRKIAIDWHTLRFDEIGTKETVVADLDRDQIKSAPEYKDSHEVVAIVTAPPTERNDIAPHPYW
jgi:hypothetical protein